MVTGVGERTYMLFLTDESPRFQIEFRGLLPELFFEKASDTFFV